MTAIEEAGKHIAHGQVCEDAGDFVAALQHYRLAVEAAPNHARSHMNAANALSKLGRDREAVDALRVAVVAEPNFAPARFNLGRLLFTLGNSSQAKSELLEASRLERDMVDAPIVLADVCESLGQFDEAESQLKRALKISPEHAGALLNLGTFYLRRGRLEDAVRLLTLAKAADPEQYEIEDVLLFSRLLRSHVDDETVAREHRDAGDALIARTPKIIRAWPNSTARGRQLRLGYVSGDFTFHPVSLFLRPVLEHHDRRQFAIFCYSNAMREDDATQVLKEKVAYWRNIARLSDDEVARQVMTDAIDILVDLSGHTTGNRLPVFARHPAPVQASWLGYLNTTGLSQISYRICDAHTDPIGVTDHLNTESLIRMPDSQWCYAPWYDIDVSDDPHPNRTSPIVFGSFNQYVKISDDCLNAWCAILARVPEAELIVYDVHHDAVSQALLQGVTRSGIDPNRVTVRGRVDIATYFRAIAEVDIALDTFPYNGATTTLDAIWMGVPLVAVQGSRAISRGSYSILKTLGAPELIARDLTQYVDINVSLSTNHDWRKRLRQSLRSRLVGSPLMDASAFTGALEDRYREMWSTWTHRHTAVRHDQSAKRLRNRFS